jgi:predicted ATPase
VFAPHGSVVLIEEHELSLHPRAIRNLMEEIRGLVDKGAGQFFITTHSPTVLENLDTHQKDHALWLFARELDGAASAERCETESQVERAINSLHLKD